VEPNGCECEFLTVRKHLTEFGYNSFENFDNPTKSEFFTLKELEKMATKRKGIGMLLLKIVSVCRDFCHPIESSLHDLSDSRMP
jgi:hypothetical protein